MAIEASIAHLSYITSSLCHKIWLVSIPKIPTFSRIHVSSVSFLFPVGHFRRPMLTMVKTSQFTHFQILTVNIFLIYIFFNFVPPDSYISYDM